MPTRLCVWCQSATPERGNPQYCHETPGIWRQMCQSARHSGVRWEGKLFTGNRSGNQKEILGVLLLQLKCKQKPIAPQVAKLHLSISACKPSLDNRDFRCLNFSPSKIKDAPRVGLLINTVDLNRFNWVVDLPLAHNCQILF